MIVQVILRKKDRNEYGGNLYAYESELPLREGDLVIAPTAKGPAYAKVVRTNVPRTELDPRWAHSLRGIIDYASLEDLWGEL